MTELVQRVGRTRRLAAARNAAARIAAPLSCSSAI
jgi:hypothetical protein